MCCGAKRSQAATNYRAQSAPAIRPAANPAPSPVVFEYTGKTALTIVSPVTGNRYRFDSPGAQQSVDARDQGTLLYVPNLRPLHSAPARE